MAIYREYAMEYLADPGAILLADPTGFAKKGTKSVGVRGNTPEHWAGLITARSPHSSPTSPRIEIGYCSTAGYTCPSTPGWPTQPAAPRPASRPTCAS